AGRRDTGAGQPIVEVGRGPITQDGTNGLVEGRQNVQKHKSDTDQHNRTGKRDDLLKHPHQLSHDDGGADGQKAAENEDKPPRNRESTVRAWECGEDPPFLARSKSLDHELAFGAPARMPTLWRGIELCKLRSVSKAFKAEA